MGEPREVMTFSGTLIRETDAEDNTVAIVNYESAYAELSASYSTRVGKMALEVYGDEGYSVADTLLGLGRGLRERPSKKLTHLRQLPPHLICS